jgi:hypothetical protein
MAARVSSVTPHLAFGSMIKLDKNLPAGRAPLLTAL